MSDVWNNYLCEGDGMPASILVDLGIREYAPLTDLTELTCLTLQFGSSREDGFPDAQAFERLCEVADAFEAAIAEHEDKIVHVGTCTTDHQRMYFFYSSNAHLTESILSAAMVGFPEYHFEVNSEADPEWSTYAEFLYPDARQGQMIASNNIIRVLEMHGDVPEIERLVRHWIYFDSLEDRSRFVQTITNIGFQVEELDGSDEDPQFGVMIAKNHSVEFNVIHQVVLDVFDVAMEHGGRYDGWETSIEIGNHNPVAQS